MINGYTKTYSFVGITLLSIASMVLTACNSEPKRVEADYGNSVTQTVQAATYNPEAAASTESIPVIGMDGKRAIRSLDAMNADVERSDDFEELINVELGN